MKFYLRLLAYVRPYTLQALAAILFMAMVGLLDAFRILLVKPIFDQVLKPGDIVNIEGVAARPSGRGSKVLARGNVSTDSR